MTPSHVLLFAFLIGALAGLRAMSPLAAVAWAAHLRWIPLAGTPLNFLTSPISVGIFTLAAIGELINDKLPKTPPRTAPPGFIARLVVGAFTGAAVGVAAHQLVLVGAVVGMVGAVVGTYGGYKARTGLVRALGVPDFVIALLEDLVAVVGSFFLFSRLG